MQVNLDPRDLVHVARQPILDRLDRVVGYELLYRETAAAHSCLTASDVAAVRVFTDALLTLGLDVLTGGLPAFFNVTKRLLTTCAAEVLPPPATVLELREDIVVDTEVVDACRRLHAAGYALALDDFVRGCEAERLLPYVKYVKVDVLATPAAARAQLASLFTPMGLKLVAEKVETAEMAREVRALGYGFVQGFYFCKPVTLSARTLPARRLAYLELLSALSRPNLTVGDVEELVKRDASMSYRILRCLNSAAFSVSREIHSIRQAIVMLGLEHIRRWASIWALAGVNHGGTHELAITAILRARCCELIGQKMSGDDLGGEYFLLGLCSLLDAILQRPLEEALTGLPVPASIREALAGQEGPARSVLEAVIAYERGDWAEADRCLSGTGLEANALSTSYVDALRWARALSQEALAA